MAYLNRQERAELLEKLKKMKFGRAKGKLNRMDPKGRMAYYRNAQQTGELVTCFELDGMGTRVFLIERMKQKTTSSALGLMKSEFEFVEVVVEPMPENRT
jgi:hypothetical protein